MDKEGSILAPVASLPSIFNGLHSDATAGRMPLAQYSRGKNNRLYILRVDREDDERKNAGALRLPNR